MIVADDRDLGTLEDRAHLEWHSDGVVDVLVGVSLIWIGAVWVWLPEFGALAGVLPAVFVAVTIGKRKRMESWNGYVKRREPRRLWDPNLRLSSPPR